MLEFNNKIAIVTGAAVGIGRAIALKLAENNSTVIATDVSASGLQELKTEINLRGGNCDTFICDISDENRVWEISNTVIEKYGKIDILINNAGIWRNNRGPFCRCRQ